MAHSAVADSIHAGPSPAPMICLFMCAHEPFSPVARASVEDEVTCACMQQREGR